jgi:hypothetical protein
MGRLMEYWDAPCPSTPHPALPDVGDPVGFTAILARGRNFDALRASGRMVDIGPCELPGLLDLPPRITHIRFAQIEADVIPLDALRTHFPRLRYLALDACAEFSYDALARLSRSVVVDLSTVDSCCLKTDAHFSRLRLFSDSTVLSPEQMTVDDLSVVGANMLVLRSTCGATKIRFESNPGPLQYDDTDFTYFNSTANLDDVCSLYVEADIIDFSPYVAPEDGAGIDITLKMKTVSDSLRVFLNGLTASGSTVQHVIHPGNVRYPHVIYVY